MKYCHDDRLKSLNERTFGLRIRHFNTKRYDDQSKKSPTEVTSKYVNGTLIQNVMMIGQKSLHEKNLRITY